MPDSNPPTNETGMVPSDKWTLNAGQCLGTDICGGGIDPANGKMPFCMNHTSLFESDGGTPPKARIVRQPQTQTEENLFVASGLDCPVQVIHAPTLSTNE